MLDSMVNAVDTVACNHYDGDNVVATHSLAEQNLATFYKKLEDLGYNLEELKPILECNETMQILACAGAGKTTVLNLKIIRDSLVGDTLKAVAIPDGHGDTMIIQKPMKILVATFLKTGADELRASLYNWCTRLGITGLSTDNIEFVTLHAEFKHALDSILNAVGQPPVKVCEDTEDIVRTLVNKYDIKSADGYGKALTADDIYELSGLLTYWRNCVTTKDIDHPVMQKFGLDQFKMQAIVYDFRQYLAQSNQVDFEMIQEYLYEYMNSNPAIKTALASRYDMVYIDEFQDTSELQYALLQTYFDAAKRIIAVGDDDQTIYSWRGSNIDIILYKFENDYHPRIMHLSTNYRCGDNILKRVVPSIEQNQYRREKTLKAYRSGGDVTLHYNYTVDELVNEVNEDLMHYETIGIISRTNNDLLIPAISIVLGVGVDCLISKSVSIQSRMPKSVCSVIDLLTKRYTANFEAILTQIMNNRYYSMEIKQLCTVLSVNADMTIFTIPSEDLEASLPEMYKRFLKPLREAKEEGGDKYALEFIWQYMLNVTFQRDTAYCNKARNFCKFLIDLITKSKYTENLDINGIDMLLTHDIPARIAKCKNPVRGKNYRIKITTVHEAKGKEWDSVIIWSDIKGTFPPRSKEKTPPAVYEEERRLHYIAWTRARDKLSVYTAPSVMSPFLEECNMEDVGISKNKNVVNITKTSKPVNVMIRDILLRALNEKIEGLSEDIESLVGVRSFDDVLGFYCSNAEKSLVGNNITESQVLAYVKDLTNSIIYDLLSENRFDF
jgi:DNA helicase-2/ATP-dependent DNA helicase PcrA